MLNLKNKKPKILIIGDFMIDHYLWGQTDRISPEAPVLVVDVKDETKGLGGAGNVVNNLFSLGAKTSILGVVGDDKVALEIQNLLQEKNAKIEKLIYEKNRQSSQKSRVLVSHQQVLRVDKESKQEILKSSEEELISCFDEIYSSFDAILLSDYGKGVLTKKICQNAINKANEARIPILIDPKGSDYSKYKNATLLTPNKKEAKEATNLDISSKESLEKAALKLKNDLGLKYSLITLSDEGIAIFKDKLRIIPAIAKEVFDVTGAGDTVLATLGYALACKMDIYEAVVLANKAAAVVVAKLGSATASFDEIIEYDKKQNQTQLEDKIISKENLAQILQNSQKKIVFTNGCFDILHSGHIKYLEKAKSFGDILIVGLNSDSSVKRLKGEQRPINSQDERAILLSALSFVDFVVVFEEDTPYELIEFLKPEILVKGEDYKGKEVVGSKLVKEVKLAKFEEGKSTSLIIKRIQNARND